MINQLKKLRQQLVALEICVTENAIKHQQRADKLALQLEAVYVHL